MQPYRIFDHTADVGVEAFGADLGELFENAAAAMYAVMTEPGSVGRAESRRIELQAEDAQALLMAWLLELLFITEAEGLVFSGFEVEASETRLEAVAHGEPFDPERHPSGAVVKAVTRHQLSVKRDSQGWSSRVIFDI